MSTPATAAAPAPAVALTTYAIEDVWKEQNDHCPICLNTDRPEKERGFFGTIRELFENAVGHRTIVGHTNDGSKAVHAFHKGCIGEWMDLGHNTCPTCRKGITMPTTILTSVIKSVKALWRSVYSILAGGLVGALIGASIGGGIGFISGFVVGGLASSACVIFKINK